MKKPYIIIAILAVAAAVVGGWVAFMAPSSVPGQPAAAPVVPSDNNPTPPVVASATSSVPTSTPLANAPTSTPKKTSPTKVQPTPLTPASTPANPTPPVTPAPQSFTVHANDSGADLTTISVPKGTSVTIDFVVAATGVYYGGLDFRSSVLNSGTIYSGQSKSVTFVAQNSFSFTPYWPSSNIAKPYKILVNVN